MKRAIYSTLALCAALAPAKAQILLDYQWSSFNGASSLPVPDANAAGATDVRTLTDEARQILQVVVNFQAEGNFNGDLYITLQHDSAFSVLLNRPGRSTENSFGYADHGFNVTFQDNAANGDIHTYQSVVTLTDGAPLTGAWQPDGRLADPSLSLTSSPRSADLHSFQSQTAGGDWVLFAADLSSGGQTQILSWGLQITVVPEPRETVTFISVALLTVTFVIQGRTRSKYSQNTSQRFRP